MLNILLFAVSLAVPATDTLAVDTLTTDGVRRMVHVAQRLDSVLRVRNLDSMGRAHGLEPRPAPLVLGIEGDTMAAARARAHQADFKWQMALLDAVPEIRAIIVAGGFTTQQYIRIFNRVASARIAVMAMTMLPADMGEDEVLAAMSAEHRADVAFVRAHRTELLQWGMSEVKIGEPPPMRCTLAFDPSVEVDADSASSVASVIPTPLKALPATETRGSDSLIVRRVTLTPGHGSLAAQLARAVAVADSAGELAVVHIGYGVLDTSCAPNRNVERALSLPSLAAALRGVRVLQVNAMEWKGHALAPFGYCKARTDTKAPENMVCPIPAFYAVDAMGKALDAGVWVETPESASVEVTAKATAVQLHEYIAAARARRRPSAVSR